MKKAKNISNLDSLQREIYRLKLEAKNMELKLDQQAEYLRHNFSTLIANSFCSTDKTETRDNGRFHTFKNEKINSFFSKVSDRIADRAIDGLEKFFDRVFHKKN